VLLLALGLLLLLGAATFEPERWPGVVGDEATYLAAAMSLAWDQDVVYQQRDLERFRRLLRRDPQGLILQRHDDGRLLFSKPLGYPLLLAPFVRAWPVRGAAIANAALLVATALAVALVMGRYLGPAAPLWVACFVFASVTFGHVFWAHADLTMACSLAIALVLLLRVRDVAAPRARSTVFALVLAGLMLGSLVAARPLYAPVLLVAPLVARGVRRWAWVFAGVVLMVVLSVAANGILHGTWTSYAGERHSFDASTGYPFDASDPRADAAASPAAPPARLSASWTERLLPFGFDLQLFGHNLRYLLAGRHVGLVPYFLPVLLGLAAWRPRAESGAALVAFALVAIAFLVLRPFNFYGGGGALANRYLLPVYPLFWFLPALSSPLAGASLARDAAGTGRRLAPSRAWLPPLCIAALAAPFLWSLWSAPRAYLFDQHGGYRYVTRFAQDWLPYETSQSWLKPSGREDFELDAKGVRLWVKPLSPAIEAIDEATLRLVPSRGPSQVLIGSPVPLAALTVELVGSHSEVLEQGLRPPVASAVHRMWWDGDRFHLYTLSLERLFGRDFEAEPSEPAESSVWQLRIEAETSIGTNESKR
jgi:hypothetical protein